MSPNAGGRGCGVSVSANEYSCAKGAQKKLWRSNSVYDAHRGNQIHPHTYSVLQSDTHEGVHFINANFTFLKVLSNYLFRKGNLKPKLRRFLDFLLLEIESIAICKNYPVDAKHFHFGPMNCRYAPHTIPPPPPQLLPADTLSEPDTDNFGCFLGRLAFVLLSISRKGAVSLLVVEFFKKY
jgi:hypothetical protein